MANSTERALKQLERANQIFEPGDSTWRVQLFDLVIWALECGLIWLVVWRWIQ